MKEQQLLRQIATLKAQVKAAERTPTTTTTTEPIVTTETTTGEKTGAEEEGQGLVVNEDKIVVLVVTYRRADHLRRCVETLLDHLPYYKNLEIVISQDGADSSVAAVAREYENKYQNIFFLQNEDRGPIPKTAANENKGYYYIARHFGIALNYAFDVAQADYTIIIEEDLEIAPDFFSYMLATRYLLSVDPTLFCVSAWNDNGRPGLVHNATHLYRSDFFPGLGWMLHANMWKELAPKWPIAYWDDWLREPQQRQGRACIFPEISRTYTFGLNDGTSHGQWADKFLKPIILNKENIEWDEIDLQTLLKDKYDEKLIKDIQGSTLVDMKSVDRYQDQTLFVEYTRREQAAAYFGLMPDEKAGVARTSYMDVITFWRGTNKIFLAAVGTYNNFKKL
eukprot:TRINITY_DN7027_c0_g1_i1.p1 TRINITY_DN7027_c0_g1~~TRINITY_DN7027_c0_g1_i1.p1  ORF type:complete len:449 (-),score=92.00 TRINITY_DN7027_c0_g1_i1:107-1288(-)